MVNKVEREQNGQLEASVVGIDTSLDRERLNLILSARINAPLNLQDTRCPRCGAAPLRATEAAGLGRDRMSSETDHDIQCDAILCPSCGARYDVIWGAPFLGAFDAHDIVGLIEIAANAHAGNGYPDSATIRRLERLLANYHQAADRTAFMRDDPDEFVRAPWFQNRYNEWLHFTTISAGIPLAGRRVLDVGAGTGVDSYRLVAAGANVTALEYNPVLVRRGRGAVPEARWFGGLSHALPFVSGSFDIVCCNAALHHMRDVETSLAEMLRVLKPGGWLLTTGDPYRARHLGEAHELAVFNRHPAVLSGINESIPSFAAFEAVLTRHRKALDISILTGVLHPAPSSSLPIRPSRLDLAGLAIRRLGARVRGTRMIRKILETQTAGDLQWWDFDRDRDTLGGSSGSIALRCRVRCEMSLSPHCQDEMVLSAGQYAQALTDYQRSVQTLAPHVPPHLVDRPFPGETQTKFDLLNGWLAPNGGPERSAYRRARWFLRRPPKTGAVTFAVRQPNPPVSGLDSIIIFVNGVEVQTVRLASDDWHDVAVSLCQLSLGEIFVFEMQLGSVPGSFDHGLFEVRDRHFS
jgi:SAM-dependent methyltransferase